MTRQEAEEVVVGLLEIAHHVLPDTFWQTDSRVNAAREMLGDHFPSDEDLEQRFDARLAQ